MQTLIQDSDLKIPSYTLCSEKGYSRLFKKHGIIFAFSTQQFNEKKQEGVKYVSLGAGILCPKENAEAYLKESENFSKTVIEKMKEKFSKEKIISYALSNYECYYTYNFHEAYKNLNALGFNYNIDEVRSVFYKNLPNVEL